MAPEIIAAGVGAAGAVAAAVVARVQFRKAKRTQERLESVVSGLTGLPEGVPVEFAEEAGYVQGIRIYRKDFVVRLWFEKTSSGRLQMEVETSFTVVNCGPKAEEHTVSSRVEPERADEDARILRLSGDGKDLLGQMFDFAYAEDAPGETQARRLLTIPPNQEKPENRVVTRFRKFAQINDSDVVYLATPTLGVTVQVEKRPADLGIAVQFGHRRGEEVETSPNAWRLRWAFLPWQSVHITWHNLAPRQQNDAEGTAVG
ncbi:MAG: hypothetical protein JWM27_2930 [Gemmatimonadetes bacterium]|nr:hypothetical protein [Gemmatimonadota bacterium]